MDFFSFTNRNAFSAPYAAPTFSKRDIAAKREKFSLKDLSEDEFNRIITAHGVLVEDVLPLTQSQAWVFFNDATLSEKFYLQALFKVKGFIRPQLFNEKIEHLVKAHAILRTVFMRGSADRPLQIVLKNRPPEIRFHDLANQSGQSLEQALEKIMAADRRRGFNLEKDCLLRIGVFRTALKEYAVLVAQPQLIADGWDVGRIFSELFLDEETKAQVARQLPEKKFSFTQYLLKRGEQDKAPALQYWKMLLKNLHRPSQVPGYEPTALSYQQMVCTAVVDPILLESLQRVAGNNTGLIALLQMAWGIMLHQYNRSNDAVFGVILSNRSAKLENIEATASIINVMPVRVTSPIDMKAEDLLRKQQMQLLLSQPYSYCTPMELQEINGADVPLCSHFLSFHSFGMERCYTQVQAVFGVTPVCVHSFDCCNVDFAIYFRRTPLGLNMEFVYNSASFNKGRIELLQQGFLAVLRQLAQKPSIQICEIKMPSLEQIQAAVDSKTLKEEIKAFLGEVSLFSNLSDLVMEELAYLAKMEYFVEGDVICSEGARQETFYVIYAGHVEISRGADNGWSRTLKILKRGSVLGYEGILDQRPSSVRAEALLGDVRVIAIPNRELCIIMRKNFDMVVNVMSELNEQVNRFQKLWISAGL